MRITSQQIQMQLQDVKVSPKVLAQLKAGTAFEGKIISIQTQAILIQMDDGSSLRAVVDQPERFVEGQSLAFQVLESEGSELPKLEILPQQKGLTEAQVKETLTNIDLKSTVDNVKAFEILKSLDLNISKNAIQTLTKNFQFLSKINESFDKIVQTPVETENVSKIDANLVTQQSQSSVDQLPQTLINEPTEALEKMSRLLKFESVEALKTADFKEVVLKVLEFNEVTQDVKTTETQPKDVIRAVMGLLRDDGNQLDMDKTMEKLGQLLKLEKPLNFKGMTLLDKLSFGDGKLSDQIKALVEQLDVEKMNPKLLSLLKGFDLKQLTTEKSVASYFDELMSSLRSLSDESPSNRIKSQSQMLMDSITFLKKDQEEVSWLQIPMRFNQQTENVDIFFKNDKKEGRQLTKDNAKILIALNTHHLDLVQAYIQVKNKTLDISFKVVDDNVKSLLEQNKSKLTSFFQENYDQVSISIDSKGAISFSEFLEEDTSHFINVKV
ncbi:MAG: hypothetical protein JEZ08_06700 [Clostridiales bacterium]|nr:hypothetical protein [Clostridiales bacterium]